MLQVLNFCQMALAFALLALFAAVCVAEEHKIFGVGLGKTGSTSLGLVECFAVVF